MDASTATLAATLAVLMVCFVTAFSLKDPETRPNAARIIQSHFGSTIVLVIFMVIFVLTETPFVSVMVDLTIAIEKCLLLLVFFRRYQSLFSDNYVYLIGLVYFLVDTFIPSFGPDPGYAVNVVVSVLTCASVLKYKNLFAADYGLVACQVLWALFCLSKTDFVANSMVGENFSAEVTLVFIVVPAYASALMILFASSYMAESQAELRELAYRDPLTGLFNRRAFYLMVNQMLAGASRRTHEHSVLIADIDYFKKVNDTYGHEAGDDVIKEFANVLSTSLREGDIIARFGGEEFVAVLVNSDLNRAKDIAERILSQLNTQPLDIEAGISITASFGIAPVLTPDQIDRDINRADNVLAQAKESGRNRIIVHALTATT